MRRLLLTVLCAVAAASARAEDAAPAHSVHLARFGEGAGPVHADGVHQLLDAARTPGQSNAVAFDRAQEGAFETVRLTAKVRVLEGGDGGSFLFLDTARLGVRGPAPFLASWVEPNLPGTFAVGLDVHNPPSREMFTPWGNYEDRPQREVSLHWDGREIVKRVAPAEFRGEFADLAVEVRHVVGGAEVTVTIAGGTVYDRYFIARMAPYEARLAIGAGTRTDATTTFDVKDVAFLGTTPAAKRRPPLHVEVFHHVRTDNAKTAWAREVDLPPRDWAFGRVILTLDLHDAGNGWDEWDRNGEISVLDDDGRKLGIVPFITSYRTPCHWEVDVTHFRPLLSGKRTIEIAAGTTFYKNRGYLMSVSLDYFHGMPDLDPYRVEPLWVGTAHYRSDENHFRDFFTPRAVGIDAEAKAARLFVTTTGHAQVGEFTPSRRTVVFRPEKGGDAQGEVRFDDVLWKTDCYLNPNRPQFGTWQFARAGWAPGDVVRPWWIDLTSALKPGVEAEVRYEPQPYEVSKEAEKPTPAQLAEASHVVRAYLILYRAPGVLVPAPTLRITGVVDGGNAARAGVKPGDFLVSYDGTPISSYEELRSAIEAAKATKKERLAIVVVRGVEWLELEVEAGMMDVKLERP
ncbi:MAG TPA: peptide-N-glycosidase F-related protein [Planctomycetota bacterium]|nr:peptide-N-glycosidase F-related protein [Planctomycetota bacterium]